MPSSVDASARRAVFLDRDGVINVDHAYVHRQDDFEYIDGIFELCRTAKQRGYALFVVTNQAGIGRGYYTESDFEGLTAWMCRRFESEGATIDQVYFCPYHPEHGIGAYKRDSPLRKPKPGMILQAARDHRIDLASSILIGDHESDIQAGIAAGVGCTILFRDAATSDAKVPTAATRCVSHLVQAQAFLKAPC